MDRLRSERGAAMVLTLIAMLLMAALGAVLMLTTSSEMLIAAAFRHGEAARYAAEAAAERVLADLSPAGNWDPLLEGSAQSTFVDGPPGGTRTLSDGSRIDLDQQLNLANCQKTTPCSVAEMNAATVERPWGANNPRWKLLAYAPLNALLPGATLNSPYYAIVLVGDDPAETDNDPTVDGADPGNPGTGIIVIRAEAFGPRGAFRAIELTLSRPAEAGDAGDYNDRVRQPGVRILSWREVR